MEILFPFFQRSRSNLNVQYLFTVRQAENPNVVYFNGFRLRLLFPSERNTAIRRGSKTAGFDGHGCVWLPHGEHGQASLRNVQDIRQQHVFLALGPRQRLWKTFSRWNIHPGSHIAMLHDQTDHSKYPVKVSLCRTFRNSLSTDSNYSTSV